MRLSRRHRGGMQSSGRKHGRWAIKGTLGTPVRDDLHHDTGRLNSLCFFLSLSLVL